MSQAEIERLLAEADRMGYAEPAAIQLVEEAVRLADAMGNLDEAFDLRLEIADRVYYSGDWNRLLVHFGWCLGQHDADPARFPAEHLLWKYKWVVNESARMTVIARDTLLGLVDDLERRFQAAGSTLRAAHGHRAVAMAKLGEPAATREAMARWLEVPRDWLADCLACEPDSEIELLEQLGEHDEALDKALALIASDRRCGEVPHRTHARALFVLRQRDPEAARAQHHAGLPLVERSVKLIEAQAQHLVYAALEGLDDVAVRMLERNLPGALTFPTAWERMLYVSAVERASEAWLTRGRESLPLRLPEGVTLEGSERGEVETAALHGWASTTAARIAADFDARNGNEEVSRWRQTWCR